MNPPPIEKITNISNGTELLLSKVKETAKELGHIYWMVDNNKKVLGFSRDNERGTHPGLVPYRILIEIDKHVRQLLGINLNEEIKKGSIGDKIKDLTPEKLNEIVEYIQTLFRASLEEGTIEQKDLDHAIGLLDDKELKDQYFANWLDEIVTRWAHANDSWGSISEIVIKTLGIDLVELSEGRIAPDKIELLNKLREEMNQIKTLKKIDSVITTIETNDQLQKVMMEAHMRWRKNKYPNMSNLKADFKDNLMPENDLDGSLKYRLAIIDSHLQQALETGLDDKISLASRIQDIRKEVEESSEISAYDSFNFMILIAKKIAKFRDVINKKFETETDASLKVDHEAIIKYLNDGLEGYLIWDLTQDSNPAVVDAILNLAPKT